MAKAVARALAESLRFTYDEETGIETESPPTTPTDGNDTDTDTSKEENVDDEKRGTDKPNGSLGAETKDSDGQVVDEGGESLDGEASPEAESGTQVVEGDGGASDHDVQLENGEVENDGKPDDVTSMEVGP